MAVQHIIISQGIMRKPIAGNCTGQNLQSGKEERKIGGKKA